MIITIYVYLLPNTTNKKSKSVFTNKNIGYTYNTLTSVSVKWRQDFTQLRKMFKHTQQNRLHIIITVLMHLRYSYTLHETTETGQVFFFQKGAAKDLYSNGVNPSSLCLCALAPSWVKCRILNGRYKNTRST